MHVHRDSSQVRSARIRCSASAGSMNSIHSRGSRAEPRGCAGRRVVDLDLQQREFVAAQGAAGHRNSSRTPQPSTRRRAHAHGLAPVVRARLQRIGLSDATRCPRRRLQHRPPARGRRPPRGPTRGRRTRRRPCCAWPSRSARTAGSRTRGPTRWSARSPRPAKPRPSTTATSCWPSRPRRCATRRNSAEVLERVREETGVDLQRAVRRGRGPADVPGRTPVVRLVGRAAAGARHRRRLARTRGRHRRGAGGGAVAAAGRRPADPRAVHARPAAGGRGRRAARVRRTGS